MKLIGSYSAAAHVVTKKKSPVWKKILLVFLCLILFFEACYFTFVYSNLPLIAHWRTVYIETALSTMSHQWLATKLLPGDLVAKSKLDVQAALESQIGLESDWSLVTPDTPGTTPEPSTPATPNTPDVPATDPAEEAFYELFWELDRESLESYLDEHPEALSGGWENLYINEAGLDDKGTSIRTTMDEQVLAIDAKNQILLVRVSGTKQGAGYRGVLAIAKDPAQLAVCASSGIGSYGQYAGQIAENHGGVLAVTANGFIDPEGRGNGGLIAGYSICEGVAYGSHYGWGYKRIELREDNRLYITDAQNSVSSDATDAVEFQPAMIVNGEIVVDANCGYMAVNPRTCIGQSEKGEILMLVIEGRLLNSAGTDVVECAEILALHKCMQAMNVDGGTSSIMWYDGEYVTQCSNTACPSGRNLPNAWVYKAID